MISNEKEFWTVGYSEWKRWQVRKAPVDQPDKYTLVEDLGPELKTVAIEADGQFTPPAHLNHFIFESEDEPWLGVVTTSGKLYIKRCRADLSTATLLATDVEQVSLCRGWRSDIWDVDAGVLCAYLKSNGTVYVRELQLVQGQQVWTDERQIATNCTAVQAVRLNDFRMGVRVEPSHKLFISERYYIGGTARTEYVYADMFCDFVVFSSPGVDEPNSDFEVVNVTAEDDYTVKVEGNYPFYWFDENWMDVECLSNNTVTSYRIENGFLYISLKNPMSTALGYIRFKFKGFNRLRFERTPQSRPIVPEITFELMQPIPIPDETVKVKFTTAAIFHETIPEHLRRAVSETVQVALTTSAVFHDVLIHDILMEEIETVKVTFSSTAAFNEQQVGDVPV